MIDPLKNEKGYQLLEIMLSLSLLSIVLLVFFGFFIQSRTFTIYTQNKMSAGQLSQEILNKVKNSSFQTDLNTSDWNDLYNENIQGDFYIEVNNQIYYPVAKIKQANLQNSSFPSQLNYIQIEIWVNEKGKRIEKYETYGFKGRN
ncbi:hypothetical protein [Neobacillus sp. PS3-40]|uniref:hypothetical protein n=1 Tax=Neobacillus sp. PS3-40 TaxID=3070679 RepID=UPI0027E01C8E|nr:hypothetical protein [Neobacillus sp. PS3-40]WML45561.1 hypothetical protein RCG20_06565 [Neobacillus sp. PS3-40]